MIPWCLAAALVGAFAQAPANPPSSAPLVSFDAIRKGLAAPRLRLQRPDPTFRIVVWETPHFFDWPDRVDVGGPRPAGGLVAFEQRRMLGNPWLGQPLFSLDVLRQAERIGQAITDTRRARTETAARQDAARPLIEMCLATACAASDR
jgi:hypothetical protein